MDRFKLELESVKSKQTQQLEEHARKQQQLEESIRNEKAAKDEATVQCQTLQDALDLANKQQNESQNYSQKLAGEVLNLQKSLEAAVKENQDDDQVLELNQ